MSEPMPSSQRCDIPEGRSITERVAAQIDRLKCEGSFRRAKDALTRAAGADGELSYQEYARASLDPEVRASFDTMRRNMMAPLNQANWLLAQLGMQPHIRSVNRVLAENELPSIGTDFVQGSVRAEFEQRREQGRSRRDR